MRKTVYLGALTFQQRLEQRGFVFGQPTPNPEQPGVTIFPCTAPWVEGAVSAGGEHIEVQNGYEFRIVSTPMLSVFAAGPVGCT